MGEMTRDEKVRQFAWAIYESVRATQTGVCLWTDAPVRGHDAAGAVVYSWLDDVGLDGEFDFIKLADDLLKRLP